MPPKKVPKLTKKQIEEEKKEAARLLKIKEEEQAQIERARLAEEARLEKIKRQKLAEEERVRIVDEKERKYPELQARIKAENQAYRKLLESENWNNFTTPYFHNYNIEGTNLSTFLNEIRKAEYKSPKDTLKLCETSELFITNLAQKILEHRTEYCKKQEKYCKQKIHELQNEQINKLQQIMIYYANCAQGMEQKNVEEAKKKNEVSMGQKLTKIFDQQHEQSPNFKIGMYIHTFTTKSVNKFAPIGIKEFGFNSEMPPKWTGNTAIVKFEWTNFNPYLPVKKADFRIVGGVYNIQFYDMAPQTKQINSITIRKYYKGKQILKNFKLQPAVIKEPFKVMYEIPKYVFLTPYTKATLKMAQFDLASSVWNILPPENVLEFMENQKRVSCKIARPEPLALVQYICSDFPYTAWELRTVEEGKILFDFELKRMLPGEEEHPLMLQFEIGPNIMKLDMGKKYPEFTDLSQNYCTPEKMLNQLSKRGLNLLPTDDDYELAGLKPKDREAEKNAIRDIAYAVQVFSIRSEPNDSSNLQVKIRQNLDFQDIFLEDQQKDWKRIRWGDRDKCWIDNLPVKQRHMNLEVLLEEHDICEKQCVSKMKHDRSFLLRKTVMKVLQLTRVLAFTTNDLNVKSSLVEVLKKKLTVD